MTALSECQLYHFIIRLTIHCSACAMRNHPVVVKAWLFLSVRISNGVKTYVRITACYRKIRRRSVSIAHTGWHLIFPWIRYWRFHCNNFFNIVDQFMASPKASIVRYLYYHTYVFLFIRNGWLRIFVFIIISWSEAIISKPVLSTK